MRRRTITLSLVSAIAGAAVCAAPVGAAPPLVVCDRYSCVNETDKPVYVSGSGFCQWGAPVQRRMFDREFFDFVVPVHGRAYVPPCSHGGLMIEIHYYQSYVADTQPTTGSS